MKRYIITGAPGTGKTTLIDYLRNDGFVCFDEVSRKIIKQQQLINGNKTPWEDVAGFTKLVYEYTLKDLEMPISGIAFSDRGLADNIAYLKLRNHSVNPFFKTFDYHKFYHKKVFVLPLWKSIYTQDPQRLQSYKEAQKLYKLLLQEYEHLGFEFYELPKNTVESRIEFIKNNI